VRHENFQGGQIKFHLENWRKITSDIDILNIVSGCEIEFTNELPLGKPLPSEIKFSAIEDLIIGSKLNSFLTCKVIEQAVHSKDQFVSKIFIRPKRNGGHRLILDLSKLNNHVSYHKFKMESLKTALTLIEKDFYMASIDLKDAYYSVPIAPKFRKYLRFTWHGKLFQFTCLPNGLSSAPRTFTKLMRPVYSTLRSMGLLSTFYLDDSLLVGSTRAECVDNVNKTIELVQSLGFSVNFDKSCVNPSQSIEFLGFLIDSKKMNVCLSNEKKSKIIQLSEFFTSYKSNFIIRDLASYIGTLVSSFPGVQYGPLHYRHLEMDKNFGLKFSKGNFDGTVQLSLRSLSEIRWWKCNVAGSFCPISRGEPDLVLYSDASLLGWGASLNGVSTSGKWSLSEKTLHINALEMKAAENGLKHFCGEKQSVCHVRLMMDNTTAVSYVNCMGGMQSKICNTISKSMWEWAISEEIWISAEFIPGSENVVADHASRVFHAPTEWALKFPVFRKVVDTLGSVDIDLFASKLNFKLTSYVSWKPDPQAFCTNAFSIDWNPLNFYAFPPFSVISQTVRKVADNRAEGIIIVPLWTTQPWFPVLMKMLVMNPILLPKRSLYLPFSKEEHPLQKNLRLIACRLSGNNLRQKDFHQKLLKSSCLPGVNQLVGSTKRTLSSGYVSVVNGKLIPLNIMK